MQDKPPRPRKPSDADALSTLKTGQAPGSRAKPAAPRRRKPTAGTRAETEDAGLHLTGQLLIAMPLMESPHFVHSVIYVCAHTPEGAMGIVLNSPLESPSFDDLLAQLGVAPTPPSRRVALCRGGPVESARGFVLHTADWTGDGSLVVDDSVALTASLDVLKAIADGGGPREGLLALGYAGWGPGQLDSEMQQNAWLSAPADVGLVFDGDHATKWRRALAVLKVDPVSLSQFSGRA